MIEQHEALPLLAEACPSFNEYWQEHLQEYGNALLYVAAGALSDHLLHLFRKDDLSSFPAVAAALESFHVEGSAWVKEFATVGVLEAIQNVWLNSLIDPSVFAAFLLPESRRSWDLLNLFWSGDAPPVFPDA